jgi:hypothetical protein
MVTVLAAAPVGLASNFLPLILVLSAGCALRGKCCGEPDKCYVCTMGVALFFFVVGLITQIKLQYMAHPDCAELKDVREDGCGYTLTDAYGGPCKDSESSICTEEWDHSDVVFEGDYADGTDDQSISIKLHRMSLLGHINFIFTFLAIGAIVFSLSIGCKAKANSVSVMQQQVPLQPAAPTFAPVAPAAAAATPTSAPAPFAAPAATGPNVRELRAQAAAAGVPPDAIEEARDADDPKAALLALIAAAKPDPAALQTLNLKDLRAKAAAAGVPANQIEDARDGDDPKQELIALIMATVAPPVVYPSMSELQVRAD